MFKYVLFFSLIAGTVQANDVMGYARIVDGDTIKLYNSPYDNIRDYTYNVRLAGIDAFESGFLGRTQYCTRPDMSVYDCGLKSKQFMYNLVEGKQVACKLHGSDNRGKRAIGVCFVGNIDIQAAIVANGWAVAEYTRKYADYRFLEQKAHIERQGAWNGYFLRPKDYRRELRSK
jgi:endonuclease YncB( thermonuclease family)